MQLTDKIFRKFFEETEQAFFIIRESKTVECNKKGLELLGCEKIDDLPENFIIGISPDFQPDGISSEVKFEQMMKVAKPETEYKIEWLLTDQQGTEFYSELFLKIVVHGSTEYMFLLIRNVDDVVSTNDQLVQSLKYEKIITRISHKFLNINPVEIEKELEESVREVASFQNIEWGAIYLLTEEEGSDKYFYKWVSSSESFVKMDNIPLLVGDDWYNIITTEGLFYFSDYDEIEDVKNLPVYFFKELGIKSIFDVPIYWGRELIGLVRFANNMQGESWTLNQVAHLKLAAEIFTGIIVKRKREIQFSETSEQFRSLINATSSAITIVRDNKIIFKNNLANDLIGESDKFNNDIVAIVHPDYRGLINNKLIRVINSDGTAERFEIPILKEDGTEIWLDVTLGKILYEKQLSIIVTAFDISKRKLAEKDLADYKNHLEDLVEKRTVELARVNTKLQEEYKNLEIAEREIRKGFDLLQTLINNVPIPLIILDKNKYFIDCNKAFLQVTGKKKSEVNDYHIDEVVEDRFKEQFNLWFEEAISCNTNMTKVGQILDAYNNLRDVVFYSSPFAVGFGASVGLIVVFWDITDTKRAEAEMLKLLEQQKELNDVKSTFISTVTHEFKTPLTAVLTSADYLRLLGNKLSSDLPEKYYEHISRIKNSVMHLTEMIDDLLTFSKSETGFLEFTAEEINLKSVCQNTIDEIRHANPKEQKVIFNMEPDLETIIIDGKLFRWILANLFTNAVKYTPKGGQIKLGIQIDETQVVLQISDNGIGIPEKDQPRIFEPFYRSMNVGEVLGTGLGLSIVKKAVDIYGGSINFTSDNSGTTFNVTLPLHDKH